MAPDLRSSDDSSPSNPAPDQGSDGSSQSPMESPPQELSESLPLKSPPTDAIAPLALVETAFLASAASLIWLVNYYFPLGPILRVFFSIPVALVYLRWDRRAAWMSALTSGLLLMVLMGPSRSVLYVMPYGLGGVLLGWLWRRGARWRWSVTLGTLLGTFGVFFRLWLLSVLLGDDLWVYLIAQVTGFLDWVFSWFGLLVRPSVFWVETGVISMVLVNNIIYMAAVHLVAWVVFDRLGVTIPDPPRWVKVILDMDD